VTATTPDPATDTPKRGLIAAAIALGSHVVVILVGLLAARLVRPSNGGGMEDLAAAVVTVLGGEILTGLACLIVSAVQFRRGWRYTGLGLMGGWIVGLVAVALLAFR
jgi:hypothetical protein